MLTDNEEIVRLGVTILMIDILVEIGRAVNIYATNALRSAGDVNFPFYLGVVVQWTVSVGLSYLLGIYWGWGLVGRKHTRGSIRQEMEQHEMGKERFYKKSVLNLRSCALS